MKRFKWEILVFLFFVFCRIPDLGHDSFNTDTWKWKTRSYDFSSGIFNLDFRKTVQKYHPGVTLMWVGTFGIKTYNLYNDIAFNKAPAENDVITVFGLDFAQKIIMVAFLALGMVFLFYPLKMLFGKKYSLLAVFLLSLEPFYLGLSRQFHLEALMTTSMLVSCAWLYYYLEAKDRRFLIISGIFTGLSILTKTTALFMIPFMLLSCALYEYQQGQGIKKTIKIISKNFLLWLLPALLTVVLLWPDLLIEPLYVLSYLYRGISEIGLEGDHIQMYFGKLVEDPGYGFYLVVLVLKSSVWLLVGLLGLLFSKKYITDKKRQGFIQQLLIFSLFYLLMITLPAKKLDRYLLPTIGGFSLLATFFYCQWLGINKSRLFLRLSGLVLIVFLTCAYLHPDYLSYYNPLLGGMKNGINILEPKWMIGTGQILDYFKNVQKQGNYELAPKDDSLEGLIRTKKIKTVLSVSFPEKYYTQIWPFFREFGAWAVIRDLEPQAKHSAYFVYPVWEDISQNDKEFGLKYVGNIYLRGVAVYHVYKKI